MERDSRCKAFRRLEHAKLQWVRPPPGGQKQKAIQVLKTVAGTDGAAASGRLWVSAEPRKPDFSAPRCAPSPVASHLHDIPELAISHQRRLWFLFVEEQPVAGEFPQRAALHLRRSEQAQPPIDQGCIAASSAAA